MPSHTTTLMEKVHKGQLAKMVLLLTFLLLTPFMSSSLRSPYLFFLFNLLILVLGADAGLLAAISKPVDLENKKPILTTATPLMITKESAVEAVVVPAAGKPKKIAESPKIQPSRPSIFFISGCDEESVEEGASEKRAVAAKMDGDMISKQELFVKAEMFIGNFHKQLKMQREDSWKKLHGLYHRAF